MTVFRWRNFDHRQSCVRDFRKSSSLEFFPKRCDDRTTAFLSSAIQEEVLREWGEYVKFFEL